MSLPNPSGIVRNPMVLTTWRKVQSAAFTGLNKCVQASRKMGAVQFLTSNDGTNALVLYIFEGKTAPFIHVLNEYMSGSKAIEPGKILSVDWQTNLTGPAL
ncbi:MAG: hypothetical protein Q9208_007021 [Pyrenodesmia sp. 3 TL-2023]